MEVNCWYDIPQNQARSLSKWRQPERTTLTQWRDCKKNIKLGSTIIQRSVNQLLDYLNYFVKLITVIFVNSALSARQLLHVLHSGVVTFQNKLYESVTIFSFVGFQGRPCQEGQWRNRLANVAVRWLWRSINIWLNHFLAPFAGLHRQPCWWSRTKAFLSSGN